MQKNAIGIFKFALAREIEGMKFYSNKLTTVKNKSLQYVFKELSEMEKDHVDYIRALIEKLSNNESAEEVKQPSQDSHFFEKREKTEFVDGKIDNTLTDLSVLRMAYLIEDDFMNFYKNAADKIEDASLKKILNNLASWEMEHRKILYELYKEASEEYWNDMGFSPF